MILPILPSRSILASISATSRYDMTLVAQMEKRPVVFVCTDINISSSSTITTIRTSLRDILLTTEVRRSSAALTGAAVDLDVVNEIRFSHLSVFDAVDGLSNAFENLLDSTDALDGDVLPFAYIIGSQWGRLGVIDVESGLDGLRIVV